MITLIATVAAALFILWTISNAAGRKKPDKGGGRNEPILRLSQGAHFGAQTNMTYERSRELDEPEHRHITCSWVTLGHAGSQSLFTEYPRVGGSIDSDRLGPFLTLRAAALS